ncbi:MAG: aminopeptidase N [Herminiimonas sp.]|nr:aminopeptidase N [Herminiimonas sp.]
MESCLHLLTPSLLALALSAAFLGNASAATALPVRPDNAFLTQIDAAARSARVSNVDYVLAFALTGGETFSGTSTVGFDLTSAASPLTLDLDGATITALVVNGKPVTPEYNQWFITLAPQDLKRGRNTVAVSYTRRHSTNGEGLHRMVDPVDGKVYTYSHFEPAAAHQMFALFDQPDLKATFAVTVTVPSDWQVVSTRRESAIEDLGATRRWRFPATKKLSPYNFSMHAGPYKVWEDNSGAYPMRLFARQSVAAQVTPADWFKYTRSGLVFFDDYFGIPYQFEKYDQLLVPDFLYGAMENAGAVTFAERGFLHKAAMTAAERERLAAVIMHEMAHQWFGDLVTMKWWNGLWLNESFASFMGTLATAEATEFTNAWQNFYSSEKQNAYVADQHLTTHPIEVPVPSTANAFDNIDSITYAKGASTLKQLRHLLGEQTFRSGVHDYLSKYAYRNARLEDFIGSLEQAAQRDLGQWTRQWLYQAGVNTIAAEYTCSNGKIDAFSLKQSAASAALPTLREQRVQVGVFGLDGGKLALRQNVAVTYQGATTPVPVLVGLACPDLVYPNYGDWGFVKARLDSRSFATAQANLARVDDPLLRAMLWQSLWDSVRDGVLPLDDFVRTVLANAPQEKDYVLLGSIVRKIETTRNYLDVMMPQSAYARQTGTDLERMSWDAVVANKNNSDFLRRWFDLYVDLATSTTAQARLADILAGKLAVDGLPINQDLRWSIIRQLNRHDYPGSAALIEAERGRDKSDAGQMAAIAATTIRPDAAIKAEWLAKVADPKTALPFSRVRVAMGNLYPAGQSVLAETTAATRLARLNDLDKTAGPVYMRSYASNLIPAACTPASVQRLADAVAGFKNLSVGTRRALLVQQEEDARCVVIKAAMTAPQS